MARLIIELTNRCNLRCLHCFGERHAATGELPVAIVETVVATARGCGIDHLCFTGGEPTLHRAFHAVVTRASEAGYTFSFVTNGSNFRTVVPLLARHREAFRGVTFSLDAACETTHDRLRGKGSYRQVMRAASLCVFNGLPFTFNTVLTTGNRDELEDIVDLAARLGSRGVRFGHLMFAPETTSNDLQLSPAERRDVEARIWKLRATSSVFVSMAPGYFSESPYFPCAPLQLQEFNLDYRGNLTLCCQLSGSAGMNDGGDVMGNLEDITLAEACDRFRARVDRYLADKRRLVQSGRLGELDHFPCWYCTKYMGKAGSPDVVPDRGWPTTALAVERRINVEIAGLSASQPGCG